MRENERSREIKTEKSGLGQELLTSNSMMIIDKSICHLDLDLIISKYETYISSIKMRHQFI